MLGCLSREFLPLRSFTIYETAARMYVVGSDAPVPEAEAGSEGGGDPASASLGHAQAPPHVPAYRVLKLDRNTHQEQAQDPHIEPDESLSIDIDPRSYTAAELAALLSAIADGNRNQGGLTEVMRAVALHIAYGIEETEVVPITRADARPTQRFGFKTELDRDEAKYKSLLTLIDLIRDCYFSYTYDLTHTIQYNYNFDSGSGSGSHAGTGGGAGTGTGAGTEKAAKSSNQEQEKGRGSGRGRGGGRVSVRGNGCKLCYVWNRSLMAHFMAAAHGKSKEEVSVSTIHSDVCGRWLVPVICGYFQQCTLSQYAGREVAVTLVARRSVDFAGTRYLKRGMSTTGKVANDVEVEQIVQTLEPRPKISALVQVRGSIPAFWEQQEGSAVQPKRAIFISRTDPSCAVARLHFEDLFARYGYPIVALNLVKCQEKWPRESIIRTEYHNTLEYLNQRLPPHLRIGLFAWDLHRAAKKAKGQVLDTLGSIADLILRRTSFFYSGPRLHRNVLAEEREKHAEAEAEAESEAEIEAAAAASGHLPGSPRPGAGVSSMSESVRRINNLSVPLFMNSVAKAIVGGTHGDGDDGDDKSIPAAKPDPHGPMEQNGVCRTNCVDSLDRTNVAQFCIGKVALGRQLYELGWLEAPSLDFFSDTVSVLMETYEDMGHVLAQQYGGSEAVNQMTAHYGAKGSSLFSKSKDLLNSLRRHIANTFTDAEKQDAYNLFLGRFTASQGVPPGRHIWEMDSDYYLHNPLPGQPSAEHITDWSAEAQRSKAWAQDAVERFRKGIEGESDARDGAEAEVKAGAEAEVKARAECIPFDSYYQPDILSTLDDLRGSEASTVRPPAGAFELNTALPPAASEVEAEAAFASTSASAAAAAAAATATSTRGSSTGTAGAGEAEGGGDSAYSRIFALQRFLRRGGKPGPGAASAQDANVSESRRGPRSSAHANGAGAGAGSTPIAPADMVAYQAYGIALKNSDADQAIFEESLMVPHRYATVSASCERFYRRLVRDSRRADLGRRTKDRDVERERERVQSQKPGMPQRGGRSAGGMSGAANPQPQPLSQSQSQPQLQVQRAAVLQAQRHQSSVRLADEERLNLAAGRRRDEAVYASHVRRRLPASNPWAGAGLNASGKSSVPRRDEVCYHRAAGNAAPDPGLAAPVSPRNQHSAAAALARDLSLAAAAFGADGADSVNADIGSDAIDPDSHSHLHAPALAFSPRSSLSMGLRMDQSDHESRPVTRLSTAANLADVSTVGAWSEWESGEFGFAPRTVKLQKRSRSRARSRFIL